MLYDDHSLSAKLPVGIQSLMDRRYTTDFRLLRKSEMMRVDKFAEWLGAC